MWTVTAFLGLAFTACALGTTCTPNVQSCVKSLFVTGECEGTACKCVGENSAIYTGCGEKTALDSMKPYIIIRSAPAGTEAYGELSGQVLKGQKVSLHCTVPNYAPLDTTKGYTWYKNDQALTSKGKTLNNIDVGNGDKYKCEVDHRPVFKSVMSEVTTLTVYDTVNAKLTKVEPKVIPVIPETSTVADETSIMFICGNRPLDSATNDDVKVEWTDKAQTKSTTLTVTRKALTTPKDPILDVGVKCKITMANQDNLEGTSQVAAKLPQKEDGQLQLVFDIPAESTIGKDTEFDPKCKILPENFYANPTVSPPTATTATNKITNTTCSVVVPGVTVDPVTAEANLDDTQGAAVDQSQNLLVEGQPAHLGCYATLKPLGELSFSWSFKNIPIPGQKDNILQLNGLQDSDNGEYKCHVSQNGQRVATGKTTITAVKVPTPVVVSDSQQFLTGTQYTLTCKTDPEVPGITYEWKDGADKKLGVGKTHTVQATGTSVSYKCTAKLGTNSQDSAVFPVQEKDIYVDIEPKVLAPVVGQSVSYTCRVSKVATILDADLTYEWKFGTAVVAGCTNGGACVINPVDKTKHTGSLSCTVKNKNANVGTATLTVSPADYLPAPTVTVTKGSFSQNGRQYVYLKGEAELTCNPASVQSGEKYSWTRGGTAVTGESKTLTISDISSDDLGTYRCIVKVGTATSLVSAGVRLMVNSVQGQYCDLSTRCPTDAYYTGHCLANRCQCTEDGMEGPGACIQADSHVENTTPKPNDSTTDPNNSGSTLLVSLFTIVAAFFIAKL